METLQKTQSSLIAIFCAVLVLTSCKEKKESTPPEDTDEPTTEVKPPKQIITSEQAFEMYKNYSTNRVPIIEAYENEKYPDQKFEASRFGDYDLATIKNYIAYVEQEAAKAKVEVSTLRFYFSNYPNKETFADGRTIKHPRQNSFFILPTTKMDGKDVGFYISKSETGESTAHPIKDLVLDYTQESSKVGAVNKDKEANYASFAPSISFKKLPPPPEDESLIMNEVNQVPPIGGTNASADFQ